MLKTVRLTNKKVTGCAMLLGGFDGLHIGHRRLLSYAKQSGLPVGIMTIVGGKSGHLFTFAEREDVFLRSGADFVFELPFAEIKDLSPKQFLGLLTEQFHPQLFVCGEDFRFGAGAVGTPKDIEGHTHVRVETQNLLQIDGEKVSSRTVKNYLQQGDVQTAAKLLGEPFFLLGEVFADRAVGRTIGFPTANIKYPQDKFPLKQGVYQTRVWVNGKAYRGITNYGARPTFDNADVLTETHLDGFSGDLYGKTLKVEFVRYLRDIQKFDSADSLKAQLQHDIRTVREYD